MRPWKLRYDSSPAVFVGGVVYHDDARIGFVLAQGGQTALELRIGAVSNDENSSGHRTLAPGVAAHLTLEPSVSQAARRPRICCDCR